jgi:predicted HTH domain antitoxin
VKFKASLDKKSVKSNYMNTENLQIKYPVGFENAVEMTRDEMEQHIRLMAALKMFELGKVSAGKAAELAGMSRLDFFETCTRYRVSIFNYPAKELAAELERDLDVLRSSSPG